MKLPGYLALVPPFLTTTYALVGSSWSVTNVPAAGLTDITFPITIVEADHISGYYFAQQYNFVGLEDEGYIGIQPRPDENGKVVLHATFSSFIPGSTTWDDDDDDNCHSGADGDKDGVSCSVEWNGVYGRKYNFEVKTSGDRRWVGTVIDTVTRKRIQIGSYVLPEGSQGIQKDQDGFVEWYPWNAHENICERLPYQKTVFGNPTTTHPGSVGTQTLSNEYGDCVGEVAFHTEKVTGGVENNCGFRGQKG